ncbi:MAG TPA: cyclase family protein [Acidiferrobacterales bacterium]|nr:cyclase family protein [Acidiferrobacterales bacterium]
MLYDLSVPIEEGMAKIPVLPEVKIRLVHGLAEGAPLEIRELTIATHIGTHMDAPSHAILGGRTIDEIPLQDVCGPCVVIRVAAQPGHAIALTEVLHSGPEIQPGDIVLLDTGWAARRQDPSYFANPYLAQDLADYLVKQQVKVVGVDCITVDMPVSARPPGFNFPIHRTLLGNGVLIIENLEDMSAVSGKRGYIWAFPIKIKGSDAGHVRVVFSLQKIAT